MQTRRADLISSQRPSRRGCTLDSKRIVGHQCFANLLVRPLQDTRVAQRLGAPAGPRSSADPLHSPRHTGRVLDQLQTSQCPEPPDRILCHLSGWLLSLDPSVLGKTRTGYLQIIIHQHESNHQRRIKRATRRTGSRTVCVGGTHGRYPAAEGGSPVQRGRRSSSRCGTSGRVCMTGRRGLACSSIWAATDPIRLFALSSSDTPQHRSIS
ncbi:hypothetical protein BDW22DRAFT_569345 [Trametopsis cervina]|nr:hypothetical protein BDW22DRAFT_569345 [Trametopsis cervina]